ncbi:MAG TPA: hypothetical protein VN327_08730, partial [Pseudonocardiaceae bacterium]|nr:hypothetical protein [Pseudonocardiaceae bacterium]
TSPEPRTTAPGRESDPQRPPGLAVDAMRWLPKPSAATAVVGMGLVAAAGLAPKSPLRKKIVS